MIGVSISLFRIISGRTKKFAFEFVMDTSKFSHAQLRAFIDHVLKCCPSLQKMLIG